jgi:hypothetical protein
MPVIYTIDGKEKVIRTRCIGNVTFAEVVGHFQVLQQDPDCPPRLDVLLDLSASTSLPQSSQLETVSREIGKLRERVRFDHCAVIAPREALFGMMRMFEVLAQPYFRATCVFREAAEAETWLVTQRMPVE